MKRKTQRRTRRRQRGGQMSRGKALAVGAVAVLAALESQPAAAQSFGTLITRWAKEGGWKNSKNLADAILMQGLTYPDEVVAALTDIVKPDAKPNGTETLPPEEKDNLTSSLNASEASAITTGGPLPEGSYTVSLASGELSPYDPAVKLPKGIQQGMRVVISQTNPQVYEGLPDITHGRLVGTGKEKVERVTEDDDIEEVELPGYYVKEHDHDDAKYFFPADAVELTMIPTGGRRTRRRKTLRRKK